MIRNPFFLFALINIWRRSFVICLAMQKGEGGAPGSQGNSKDLEGADPFSYQLVLYMVAAPKS